jgi:hypothetical protein
MLKFSTRLVVDERLGRQQLLGGAYVGAMVSFLSLY